MRRGDDVTLARALAEALDGRAEPTGELQAIVRVLEAAAAEARFDVAAAETERALESARPPARSRRRWPVPVAVAAAAAIALAVVLVLASPFGSSPGVDVQAQALAALGGPGVVLEVSERIVPGPAGGFAASTRTGWIDPARGRAAWTQRTAAGTVVDQTLVERGRITRYDPATATAVVARTCAALATGCAAAVDPVAVYRQALLRVAATSARPVTFHGKSAYRFSLPVVRLADATRIAQIVTVDARSLLPKRIEWRVHGPRSRARTVAVIDVEHVAAVPRDFAPQDAFALPLAPGTAVTQLAAPGRPVRLVSTRPLTVAQARALRPRIDWLGPRFRAHRLGAITLYRYNAGVAVRLRYGPLLVWNYGPVVPPGLISRLLVPIKQVPVGRRTARMYATAGGAFAGEIDRRGGTAVAIAAAAQSESVFLAVSRLRPMAGAG
jgi:hypothetical protein